MKNLLILITTCFTLALIASGQAKMTTTKTGLKYVDQKVGTGEIAVKGSTVSVLYIGWLYENGTRGKQFDSSQDPKKPFQVKLGARQVIPGWEEGIEGMKVGGKRELIIPPDLAYGARGFPGAIPPNATITFEIDLLSVSK